MLARVRQWNRSRRRLYVSILPQEMRFWGRQTDWYDGPISSFGLWWFAVDLMLPPRRA